MGIIAGPGLGFVFLVGVFHGDGQFHVVGVFEADREAVLAGFEGFQIRALERDHGAAGSAGVIGAVDHSAVHQNVAEVAVLHVQMQGDIRFAAFGIGSVRSLQHGQRAEAEADVVVLGDVTVVAGDLEIGFDRVGGAAGLLLLAGEGDGEAVAADEAVHRRGCVVGQRRAVVDLDGARGADRQRAAGDRKGGAAADHLVVGGHVQAVRVKDLHAAGFDRGACRTCIRHSNGARSGSDAMAFEKLVAAGAVADGCGVGQAQRRIVIDLFRRGRNCYAAFGNADGHGQRRAGIGAGFGGFPTDAEAFDADGDLGFLAGLDGFGGRLELQLADRVGRESGNGEVISDQAEGCTVVDFFDGCAGLERNIQSYRSRRGFRSRCRRGFRSRYRRGFRSRCRRGFRCRFRCGFQGRFRRGFGSRLQGRFRRGFGSRLRGRFRGRFRSRLRGRFQRRFRRGFGGRFRRRLRGGFRTRLRGRFRRGLRIGSNSFPLRDQPAVHIRDQRISGRDQGFCAVQAKYRGLRNQIVGAVAELPAEEAKILLRSLLQMLLAQAEQRMRICDGKDVVTAEQRILRLIVSGKIMDAMACTVVDQTENDQQFTGFFTGGEQGSVAARAFGPIGKDGGGQINSGAVGKGLGQGGQIRRAALIRCDPNSLHEIALRRHDIQSVFTQGSERELSDGRRCGRGLGGRFQSGFRCRLRSRLGCGFRGGFRGGFGSRFRSRIGSGFRRRLGAAGILGFGFGREKLARLAVDADVQAAVPAESRFRIGNIFKDRLALFIQLDGLASVRAFFRHRLLQIKAQLAVISIGSDRKNGADLKQHGGAENGAEHGFGLFFHAITS